MEGATATLHLLMQYYSYQAESNFASAAKHPCHLLIEKRLLRWFACPNVEELRLRGWGMQSLLPVASYHDCNYNYDSDGPGEKKMTHFHRFEIITSNSFPYKKPRTFGCFSGSFLASSKVFF